jgi:hypothetical protein
MKRRIFGTGPGRPRITVVFRRRIPLGWAALIALFAGLAGMYIQKWVSGPTPLPSEMVIVQIIEAPSDRNLFDFTEPAADWMPGKLSVEAQGPKEI